MRTGSLLTIFFAGWAAASAFPRRAAGAPLDGYDVDFLTWTGPVDKEGTEVTLKGTIEQIIAQAREINPDFDSDDIEEEDLDEITKRGKPKAMGKHFCGVGGNGPGGVPSFTDGIKTLKKLGKGICTVAGGPRRCTRFSCSWDSAIWLCNDKTTTLQIPCEDLAPWAQNVIDLCSFYDWRPKTQGQVFGPDNWNVILGGDKC